ncbi:tRNA lysidine(34) synthetase TilS [Planctomycetota bacterium]
MPQAITVMNEKSTEHFIAAVYEQIASWDICELSSRWLIGISGGCDSMALLHAMVKLGESYPEQLAYLHLAHLNHQLRGEESEADAEFVSEQAKRLGLSITVGTVDAAGAARETGESIETAARNERFRFLAETARKFECQIIAVGHNADDQAETILHRILRGTGIRGLGGMEPVRSLPNGDGQEDLWLVRPLLGLRRAEIGNFLQEQGISWRQDRSNESVEFTRNRIRHQLLPQLADQFNPRVVEALLQLGQTAQWCGAILGEEAGKDLADMTINQTDGSLTLDVELLKGQPHIKQAEIIHQALLTLKAPQQRIGFKHIRAALELIGQVENAEGVLSFPYDLKIQRKQNQLIMGAGPSETASTSPAPPEVILTRRGKTSLPEGFLGLDPATLEAYPVEEVITESIAGGQDGLARFCRGKSFRQEMFDGDKIQGTLRLRCRRDGDRFWPLGGGGIKKLGDFFTDAKVPTQLRDRVGLVCDDEGILWILGLRISERCKINPSTNRILKITIK